MKLSMVLHFSLQLFHNITHLNAGLDEKIWTTVNIFFSQSN